MAKSFSRRTILKSGAAVAAIPFSLWFQRYAKADPPMVRYSLSSIQGAAMLAQYSNAVATMMMKGAGDPCSWLSQWYTHAVPFTTSKSAEIMKLTAAQQVLAHEIWDTCQPHHMGTLEEYFLPWHRMFVYFFERIVRKTVGDPAFALPYWDYVDSAQRALPAAFRVPAGSGNPLYRGNRDSNGGLPIDHAASSPATSPINLDDMRQSDYVQFNANLDGRLHGSVHTLVGNTVGMGQVPYACGDPVFWMHHCNIDRVWAGWNQQGGVNPTDAAWLDQTFVFADENCNRVVAKISDFNSIDQLSYTYDQFPRILRLPRLREEYEICILRLIGLPPGPGPLHLQIPMSRPAESLHQLIGSLKAGSQVILTIRNLDASAPVGAVYELFLGAFAGKQRVVRGTAAIGAINFFDAVRMQGMERSSKGRSLEFDITTPLRALNRRSRLTQSVPLTIQPMGKVNAEAKAVIGEIRISITR